MDSFTVGVNYEHEKDRCYLKDAGSPGILQKLNIRSRYHEARDYDVTTFRRTTVPDCNIKTDAFLSLDCSLRKSKFQ